MFVIVICYFYLFRLFFKVCKKLLNSQRYLRFICKTIMINWKNLYYIYARLYPGLMYIYYSLKGYFTYIPWFSYVYINRQIFEFPLNSEIFKGNQFKCKCLK